MNQEKITTIQLTSKRLKANKAFSWATILFGLLLMCIYGQASSQGGVVLGCFTSLGGFCWLAVTRVRIWWNHS
jgi:hypothetical protein